MAPSTSTPSNLHRAPVACLACRAAKVRCLVERRADRCDRCINHGTTECVFTQPRRSRTRIARKTAQRRARTNPSPHSALSSPETPAANAEPTVQSDRRSASVSAHGSPTHPLCSSPRAQCPEPEPPQTQLLQPLVTGEVRARLVAALATLRGKRGAPFTFVTSGDVPTFSSVPDQESAPDPPITLRQRQQSLKLSWLLKPLVPAPVDSQSDSNRSNPSFVNMPSYLSSMTLGQTITDPVDGGIISYQSSQALFDHFMIEINAKWEYIFNPHEDTHESIRRRSGLLFTTILFCSSKFVSCVGETLTHTTDPYLQSRLCSLARNLAIKTFAEGNRSLEMMQAFYLLACRKEPDDDISYLHSAYAFRVLQEVELERIDCDGPHAARFWRTWLALFRQDKQQSLFFMKKGLFGYSDDDEVSPTGEVTTWLKNHQALPLDSVASCFADLRRLQAKLHGMVHKASSTMQPCILDLMEFELTRWTSTWQGVFDGNIGSPSASGQLPYEGNAFHPGERHINTLMKVYEQSVRLNVASAIFRQALMASVTAPYRARSQSFSSLRLDLPAVVQMLSTDVPGLRSSIEGAFGTLEQLLAFSTADLRRSPDAVLLLGPSAALFLCLLLCLPCCGILGRSFQKTAISLISDIAQHVGHAVQSPQDIVGLHAAYLDSLVQILGPACRRFRGSEASPSTQSQQVLGPTVDGNFAQNQHEASLFPAANVLTAGLAAGQYDTLGYADAMYGLSSGQEHDIHMQGLVNLLGADCWSELPMSLE